MIPRKEDIAAHSQEVAKLYRTKQKGDLVWVPSMGGWLMIYEVVGVHKYQHCMFIECEDPQIGFLYTSGLMTFTELGEKHPRVLGALMRKGIYNDKLMSP